MQPANGDHNPKRGRKSKRNKRPAEDPPEGETNERTKKALLELQTSMSQITTEVKSSEDAILEVASKVGDCMDSQTDMAQTMNVHSDNICQNKSDIKSLRAENERLVKRLDNMDAAMKSAIERIGLVEHTADANSHLLKNANIVLEGLPEKDNENCATKCCDIFKIIEGKFAMGDMISAYRVGQKAGEEKYIRPVVVKLRDPYVKLIIMENKGILKDHPEYGKIYLNDDLPPRIKKERKTLRDISRYATQIGYKGCRASGSKLVINGRAYRYHTLHLLPSDLQMCNIKTRRVGDGLGFQGEDSYLSNFYPVTLTVENQSFNCAEQAFQFFKARTCKRDEAADKILSLSNPREIKLAGDNVPSKAVWEANKEAFMRSVIYSKFHQNNELKMKLLATEDIPLYECVTNRWWGCGFRLDAPEWANIKPPGLNKTGQIIMEVRKALRKSTWTADAMTKSPAKILAAANIMSQKIQNLGELENERETAPGVQPPVATGPHELMEVQEGAGATPALDPTKTSGDEDDEDGDEDGDLLEETDADEESVDISASSTVSTAGDSRLNVTDQHGKLDLSKVRSWSIPKLKKPDELHRSHTSDKSLTQHVRRSLPLTSVDGEPPQASSTPNTRSEDRSVFMERVKDKLNKSELKHKD